MECQKPISFAFDGVEFEKVFQLDLIVERSFIVEVKAVETLAFVHERQLHTYLKILDYRLGLLINVGTPLIKQGIRRVVNGF